jgi:acetyl-CoA carboxylase, biotin carboxylase subunit
VTPRQPPFRTVLIANRGEIALRVARTCRELGSRVIAVYSTDDRDSAVVRFADAAVHIGPAPARRSYLNIAAVVAAAMHSGADAVHPGYGFLSEDPDFAEVCEANGLVFVGPPADVMARLGDKAAARALMRDAGLPLLPGSLHPVDTVELAAQIADDIGYPVVIKASAGGGGRGIEVVTGPGELAGKFRDTRASAHALFGDSRVYLERFLRHARHIEVQILGDRYGGAVHLGERDCSVQRRHQKLIEETPAPRLAEATAADICAAAVTGAQAVGFVGAGTFEFLMDDQGAFYFIEVNSRIQVEHPVTEMVTGIDLVAEQLRLAAGHPLSVSQGDVRRRGVAVECRVNAEDPARGFAPTPGPLTEFIPPGGPFVRVDTHYHAGTSVSAAYDSLLAKVITWAPDRDGALDRMARALDEFTITGPMIRTTAGFLRSVLDEPAFRLATHSTSLINEMAIGGPADE